MYTLPPPTPAHQRITQQAVGPACTVGWQVSKHPCHLDFRSPLASANFVQLGRNTLLRTKARKRLVTSSPSLVARRCFSKGVPYRGQIPQFAKPNQRRSSNVSISFWSMAPDHHVQLDGPHARTRAHVRGRWVLYQVSGLILIAGQYPIRSEELPTATAFVFLAATMGLWLINSQNAWDRSDTSLYSDDWCSCHRVQG